MLKRLRYVVLAAVMLSATLLMAPAAKATCSAAPNPINGDNTAALNAWVASIPNGGCGTLKKATTYEVDGTFLIGSRTGITVDGLGATLQTNVLVGCTGSPKCSWRRHVMLSNDTNVTVKNLTVDSANPTCAYNSLYEGEAGFTVAGGSGNHLTSDKAKEVAGDGFLVSGYSPAPGTEYQALNTTIAMPTVSCAGRQGIAVVNADGLTITGGSIADVPRSAFDLESDSDSQSVNNVTASGTTVGTFGNLFLSSGGPGTRTNVSLTNMTTTLLQSKIGSPNGIVDRFNFTLSGITATQTLPFQSGASGVAFLGTSGVTFNNNHQIFGGPMQALSLGDSSCEASAGGNSMTGASAFWPPPGPPGPPGCTWTDTGGNTI